MGDPLQHTSEEEAEIGVISSNVTATRPTFSSKAKASAQKRFPQDNCSIDWFESGDFADDCNSITLLDRIASGAFGVVYKALISGLTYAVKVEDFHPGDEEQTNLLVELSILQSLPHERLVRFIVAGSMNTSLQGAKIMIVMELCENGDLRHNIHLRLPWALKIRLALDVAIGLAFLHEHGIIHRDIKTTNVLVDASWRARLCDFSFAIHSSSQAKREFTYGTEEFMSPEIALALDFDTPTDIFSFGIMLCELITEKEPSREFMHRTPNTHFALYEEEVKSAIVEGCPEALEALTLNCCDFDPAKRPSAMTCVEELQALFENLGGEDAIILPEKANATRSDSMHELDSSISPGREGTVNYPKTPNLSVVRQSSQWGPPVDPQDHNARLEALEIQMQELRAENRSLTRQLHALVSIVADRDPKVHTSSAASSISSPSSSPRDSLKAQSSFLTLISAMQQQIDALKVTVEDQALAMRNMSTAESSAVPPSRKGSKDSNDRSEKFVKLVDSEVEGANEDDEAARRKAFRSPMRQRSVSSESVENSPRRSASSGLVSSDSFSSTPTTKSISMATSTSSSSPRNVRASAPNTQTPIANGNAAPTSTTRAPNSVILTRQARDFTGFDAEVLSLTPSKSSSGRPLSASSAAQITNYNNKDSESILEPSPIASHQYDRAWTEQQSSTLNSSKSANGYSPAPGAAKVKSNMPNPPPSSSSSSSSSPTPSSSSISANPTDDLSKALGSFMNIIGKCSANSTRTRQIMAAVDDLSHISIRNSISEKSKTSSSSPRASSASPTSFNTPATKSGVGRFESYNASNNNMSTPISSSSSSASAVNATPYSSSNSPSYWRDVPTPQHASSSLLRVFDSREVGFDDGKNKGIGFDNSKKSSNLSGSSTTAPSSSSSSSSTSSTPASSTPSSAPYKAMSTHVKTPHRAPIVPHTPNSQSHSTIGPPPSAHKSYHSTTLNHTSFYDPAQIARTQWAIDKTENSDPSGQLGGGSAGGHQLHNKTHWAISDADPPKVSQSSDVSSEFKSLRKLISGTSTTQSSTSFTAASSSSSSSSFASSSSSSSSRVVNLGEATSRSVRIAGTSAEIEPGPRKQTTTLAAFAPAPAPAPTPTSVSQSSLSSSTTTTSNNVGGWTSTKFGIGSNTTANIFPMREADPVPTIRNSSPPKSLSRVLKDS